MILEQKLFDSWKNCYNRNFSKRLNRLLWVLFYLTLTMENILKAAENSQVAPVGETINESLFLEFMNKVAIWDYFGINKAHYLTLAESEKRDMITKYYLDMKSCNNTGKMYIFFVFYFLFYFENGTQTVECLVLRDSPSDVNKEANE